MGIYVTKDLIILFMVVTFILNLLKDETIYIVNEDRFHQFKDLLEQNIHVKAFIGDYKRGYLFQYRIIFDTYQFLTTPIDELLVDDYRIFERPINTYLHEVFCKQQALHTFKLANQNQPLLCLLVSIFIAKKMVSILYDLAQNETASATYENLLELLNPSDRNIDSIQQQQIINLQTIVLQNLKEAGIPYDKLISEAIKEARAIHSFMLGVR